MALLMLTAHPTFVPDERFLRKLVQSAESYMLFPHGCKAEHADLPRLSAPRLWKVHVSDMEAGVL